LLEGAEVHDAGRGTARVVQRDRPLHESGQPIDMIARIKRRQVVHGPISEYRRAG